MSTTKFINTVIREIERGQRQAAKERERREREYIREQNRRERERVRIEKEEEREKKRLSAEQFRIYKEKVKREWESGSQECEKRSKERNQLWLTYIK